MKQKISLSPNGDFASPQGHRSYRKKENLEMNILSKSTLQFSVFDKKIGPQFSVQVRNTSQGLPQITVDNKSATKFDFKTNSRLGKREFPENFEQRPMRISKTISDRGGKENIIILTEVLEKSNASYEEIKLGVENFVRTRGENYTLREIQKWAEKETSGSNFLSGATFEKVFRSATETFQRFLEAFGCVVSADNNERASILHKVWIEYSYLLKRVFEKLGQSDIRQEVETPKRKIIPDKEKEALAKNSPMPSELRERKGSIRLLPKLLVDNSSQTEIEDIVENLEEEEDLHIKNIKDGPFNEVIAKILSDDDAITHKRKKEQDSEEELSKKMAQMISNEVNLEMGLLDFKKDEKVDLKKLEKEIPAKLNECHSMLDSLEEEMKKAVPEVKEGWLKKVDEIHEEFRLYTALVKKFQSLKESNLVLLQIEFTEKDMLMREARQAAENWQVRFDALYSKYVKLQNILLYESQEARLKQLQKQDKEVKPNVEPEFQKRSGRKNSTLIQTTQVLPAQVQSPNQTSAQKFIQRIKSLPLQANKSTNGEYLLTKILSAIYTDLMRGDKYLQTKSPLYVSLYDYLINFYGNKQRTAETKFAETIRLALAQQEKPKIRMFLKFLTIIVDQPYEHDMHDLTFYFNCLKGMDEIKRQSQGLSFVVTPELETKISLTQGINFVKGLVEKDEEMKKRISLNDCLNDLKTAKTPDPIIKGRWLVDVDLLIESLILYRFTFSQKSYKPLFDALDFEHSGMLHLEHFFMVMRCLIGSAFLQEAMLGKFLQIADIHNSESNKRYLSFKGFANFLEKYVRHSDLEEFVNRNLFGDHCTNLLALESNWNFKKNLIKLRYLQNGQYGILHQKMLATLEEYMKSSFKGNFDTQILWLRYKLLDVDGFERYIRSVVYSFLPDELIDLNFALHKLTINLHLG